MENGITPVNATRLERVQGAVNLPVDPEKLAALRAKLELPPLPQQQANSMGTDEVLISEMGKALYRFSKALAADPQMMQAFTANLPAALREELQNMQSAAPPAQRYDAALQLCMALYGPQVQARAATYGKNRKGRISYLDYYRALFEHFGLSYDDDAPEDSRSPLERFFDNVKQAVGEIKDALNSGGQEDGAQQQANGETEEKSAARPEETAPEPAEASSEKAAPEEVNAAPEPAETAAAEPPAAPGGSIPPPPALTLWPHTGRKKT